MRAVSTWLADTVGNGTGTKNAVGNYASAAQKFLVTAPSDGELHVYRLILTIRDTGSFDAEDYGNGVALTNGIECGVYDASDNLAYDLLDGEKVFSNSDWGRYCFDVDVKTWGAGDEYLVARWTFSKFGGPIQIQDGESVGVELNDNFTALVEHYFCFEGTGKR